MLISCFADQTGWLWGQGTHGETPELSSQVMPSTGSLQNCGQGGSGKSGTTLVAASLCLHLAQDSGIDIGDITARKALRKQLQCKTFRWYLVSVYPEMRMYPDIIAYGVVRSPPLGFHPDTCAQLGPVVDLGTRGWFLELHVKQPIRS